MRKLIYLCTFYCIYKGTGGEKLNFLVMLLLGKHTKEFVGQGSIH